MAKEICISCEEETRAGGRDSYFSELRGDGPFCQECFDSMGCQNCCDISYIKSTPEDEKTGCTMCHCNGYRT